MRNKLKNPNGTYKPEVVQEAIRLLKERNLSISEVGKKLYEKYKVKIPDRTIRRWSDNYLATVLIETNRRVIEKLAESPDAPLTAFIDPITVKILEYYHSVLNRKKIPKGREGIRLIGEITRGLKELAVAVEKIKGRARKVEVEEKKTTPQFPGVMNDEEDTNSESD